MRCRSIYLCNAVTLWPLPSWISMDLYGSLLWTALTHYYGPVPSGSAALCCVREYALSQLCCARLGLQHGASHGASAPDTLLPLSAIHNRAAQCKIPYYNTRILMDAGWKLFRAHVSAVGPYTASSSGTCAQHQQVP